MKEEEEVEEQSARRKWIREKWIEIGWALRCSHDMLAAGIPIHHDRLSR
jgi:hypothetical protein